MFTDATGMSPSYVSQLLRQHRTIGEKTARKIEMYSGLEPGALDAVSAETEIIAPMVVEKAPPLHHSPRTRTLLERIAELVAAGRISEEALQVAVDYLASDGHDPDTTIKGLTSSIGEQIINAPDEVQSVIMALLMRYESDRESGSEVARAIKTLMGIK